MGLDGDGTAAEGRPAAFCFRWFLPALERPGTDGVGPGQPPAVATGVGASDEVRVASNALGRDTLAYG